jgi:hypothetical protein
MAKKGKAKKGKAPRAPHTTVKPDPPGNKYPDVTTFLNMDQNTPPDVPVDVKAIRMALTALRKSMFASLGVVEGDYVHAIRIQPKNLHAKPSLFSGSCGCGCS